MSLKSLVVAPQGDSTTMHGFQSGTFYEGAASLALRGAPTRIRTHERHGMQERTWPPRHLQPLRPQTQQKTPQTLEGPHRACACRTPQRGQARGLVRPAVILRPWRVRAIPRVTGLTSLATSAQLQRAARPLLRFIQQSCARLTLGPGGSTTTTNSSAQLGMGHLVK